MTRIPALVPMAGLALSTLASMPADAGPLMVDMDTGVPRDFTLHCELYLDAATWKAREPAQRAAATIRGDRASCALEVEVDHPVAVRVHGDRDGDDRLDRGMFRTPREPWAVSGGAGFGASFEEAAFAADVGTIEVRLRTTADTTVLPGAFYGQETGLGLAALATVAGRVRGATESTWPSALTMAVIGTTKGQASIALWPNLYLGDANTWMLEGTLIAEHFPIRYYGIGQDAGSNFQEFTRRKIEAEASVQRRLVGDLYVGGAVQGVGVGLRDIGPEIEAKSGHPLASPSGEPLLGSGVVGDEGSRLIGAVATLRWDTRDNVQSTRSGVFARLDAGGFPAPLSTHGHAVARADTRIYLPFLDSGRVAGRVLVEGRRGDVPFSAMGELGGDEVLRGLFQGRFRDHDLAVAELEVRSPMLWRFRAVGFGGVGQVANLADAAPDPLDPTWIVGGGLRFEVDPQAHTTIRLDIAGGPDGSGFIFNFGEAF